MSGPFYQGPARRSIGVRCEKTPLSQKPVLGLSRRDERKAENVAAQRRTVFLGSELPKRDEINGDISVDRAANEHTAGFVDGRYVDKTALRKRALCVPFGLLFLFIREDVKLRVVDGGNVLRRAPERIDVPRADHRLHEARKLCALAARVPRAKNKRRRRKLCDGSRVATLQKIGKGPLRFLLQGG